MNRELENSLSLSNHISKYPLAYTALACLFCFCFTQRHQVSLYASAGTNGEFAFLTLVPAFALVLVGLALYVGLVRGKEQSVPKRALYISAGAGMTFLCCRGLLLASDTVFKLSVMLICVASFITAFYLFINRKIVSSALAAVSLLSLGFFAGFGIWFYVAAVLLFALYILFCDEALLPKRMVSAAALVLSAVLVPVLYSSADTKTSGVFVSGVLLCVGGFVVAELRGKSKIPSAIIFMFGLGLVMRLGYVLDIELPVNQHDVFSLFQDKYPRHNSYILYIYENWSLPTESVYNAGLSQYYHPPLYHFLAALWMKLQTLFGVELYAAYENVQYFTMFCSAAMMTAAYKLFCEFKLKGIALYTAFAIIAFHPTFFIFAGSVNNDPLTTLFLFLAVLYTVRWYKEQSFKNSLLLALCIGGAMMSKLSGAMVAVGTAYVMLVRLFDKSTGGFVCNLKKLWSRFAVFGAVCFPMGLWWPVRCALKYGMPLGYVPALSEGSVLYVGDYSFIQRLTGIGSWSLSNVYPNVGNTAMDGSAITEGVNRFYDYGIAPYIVKSSLFGEYFWKTGVGGVQNALAYVMTFSAIALIGVSLYAMIKLIIKTKGEYAVPLRFLGIYFAALVGSYVMFCFTYPHTCTMDFRYIVPTLLIGAVFSGLLINKNGEKNAVKYTLFAVTMVFCVASAGFYALSY